MFKITRKVPISNDLMKICIKGSAINGMANFITFVIKPSSPIPLLFERPLTTVIISLDVRGAMKIEDTFEGGIVSVYEQFTGIGDIFCAKFGPILTKKSLKLEAMSN